MSESFMPATVASRMGVMDATDTDEALMLRYSTGDADAFAVLYDRHKGALYRYFLRQCPAAVADELFQDVWMNLVRARERYTVQAKFTTYLFRLAHNRLIDYYRRQSNTNSWADMTIWQNDQSGQAAAEQTVEDLPVESHQEPDNQAHIRSQVARLLELLPTLPAPQREAFLLREEGGLSLEEIAESTGVEKETAKSRLRYALARLRRGLRESV